VDAHSDHWQSQKRKASAFLADTNDGDVPIGATGRGRLKRSKGGSASAIKKRRESLSDWPARGEILLQLRTLEAALDQRRRSLSGLFLTDTT
jgi:hypothetical protein